MKHPDIPNSLLRTRRNNYAYPAYSLEGQPDNWTEIQFSTVSSLENYLATKLRSQSRQEVLKGYLGTVFWGHAFRSDGGDIRDRAHGFVHMAYHGKGKKAKNETKPRKSVKTLGTEYVTDQIQTSVQLIESDSLGEALHELGKVPLLGPAFASRYARLLIPKNAES